VLNKLVDFNHLIYSDCIDLVFVTETWLKPNVPNGLLDPDNKFEIIRYDRPYRVGGGVGILVSKKLNFCEVTVDDSDLEIKCIDVTCDTKKYRFMNVYRPPGHASDKVYYMTQLILCLTKLSSVKWPVTIVGDLNCPDIDWRLLSAPRDGVQNTFLDFLCEYGFFQMISQPTRINNIVDLVATTEPLLISDIAIEPPFVDSADHNTVYFTVTNSANVTTPQLVSNDRQYDWSRADYVAMSDYIACIDWCSLLAVNFTADSLWAAFCDILHSVIDMFVPAKTYCVSASHGEPAKKYPAYIRRAMTSKCCLWRQHKLYPEDIDMHNSYRRVQFKCRQLIRDFEVKKERKIIKADNIGKFYKFVNKKLSCSSGVGALLNKENILVTDDNAKANVLNEFFASVCTADNGSTPSVRHVVPPDVKLDSVNFTCDAILKAMMKMKSNTSSGPDGFPPVILKKLGSSLALPLSLIFTSFMSVGQVPSDWKNAIITPIYKKGLASDPSNYRPISLTSVFCKLMERVIALDMLTYLRHHGLITRHQHGFIAKRSTTTNLLECLNDWSIALKDHHSVTVAYIDFSKAFDTVCKSKLLCKLSALGITGNLLLWINNFLTGRTQCTRVGSSYSQTAPLISGIVQGSCLGPLLFLLYINDVATLFDSAITCKLYADDVKLYSVVKTNSDFALLQDSLDRLYAWSDQWQLTISTKKCASIQIGSGCEKTPSYHIGDCSIDDVRDIRDLGVVIEPSLKFHKHINLIVAKARSRSSLIFKCFVSRDRTSLLQAYKTYVRPLLEYSSCAWSPKFVTDIVHLESVQRQFTKRLPGLRNMEYDKRLSILNLESLELRRLRFDFILTYKILLGFLDVNKSDFFTVRQNNNTRGHQYKLVSNHCLIDIRKHFFCQTVVGPWNSLPPDIIDFSSLVALKKTLSRVDLSDFLMVF
jgi:hypothetical protein